MAFPPALTRFDDVYDFLASTPSPEEILAYSPPTELQERLAALLERNRQGEISRDEERELDEFLRLDRFFGKLKLHARRKLINA